MCLAAYSHQVLTVHWQLKIINEFLCSLTVKRGMLSVYTADTNVPQLTTHLFLSSHSAHSELTSGSAVWQYVSLCSELLHCIQHNTSRQWNVLFVNMTAGLISADRLHSQPTWLPNIAVCWGRLSHQSRVYTHDAQHVQQHNTVQEKRGQKGRGRGDRQLVSRGK